MGLCVGVGGRVAVGVEVCADVAAVVGTGVVVTVDVGGKPISTSVIRRHRNRRLLMPRQYRSRVKPVTTATRLYSRFWATVSPA